MSDVIEIENYIDGGCVRHLHLMSNEPIGEEALRSYGLVRDRAQVERGETAGSHWLRAQGPCRAVWDVGAACAEGKFRRLVVWSFEGCGSMREAMGGAARDFRLIFGFAPKYAFVRRLPRGVENCTPLALRALFRNSESANLGEDSELMLLEAEWMMERCVAVGGMATPPPAPSHFQSAKMGKGE